MLYHADYLSHMFFLNLLDNMQLDASHLAYDKYRQRQNIAK